jgi:hypothetical protein
LPLSRNPCPWIYNSLKSNKVYVIGQRRVIVIGRRCRR